MKVIVPLDNPSIETVNALIRARAKLPKGSDRAEMALTVVIEDMTEVLLERDRKELRHVSLDR
jgi:hypothetical protein